MEMTEDQQKKHRELFDCIYELHMNKMPLNYVKLKIKQALDDGLDINAKIGGYDNYDNISLLEFAHFDTSLYPRRFREETLELQVFLIEKGALPVIGESSYYDEMLVKVVDQLNRNSYVPEDALKNLLIDCIEHGANPGMQKEDEEPVFHQVCAHGFVDVAKVFIEHGVSVDGIYVTDYETQFSHVPAYITPLNNTSSYEVMKLLIESGADVNANDGFKGTA
ncbi:MAG TPA: ankyrin repeat domain-containing protein [Anaerovoracaceae bacterium]|nr:ankyrin repeat domain-containing protein [Anaerovoracaceae bacterium]